MKNKNITFSMPAKLIEQLHAIAAGRSLSHFVAQAVEKAIEAEMQALEAEYSAANKDSDRLKTIKEWEFLDSEGWE